MPRQQRYKCLECFLSKNAHKNILDQDHLSQLKTKFKEYENASSQDLVSVESSARQFSDLLLNVDSVGCHPDEIFPPIKACDVLTSLLSAGIRTTRHLSEVLKTVYHCVRLSQEYHRQLYNTRKFWVILFENIFSLPDQQFFESVMIFIYVVAQTFTDRAKSLTYTSYYILVEDYLYLTGSFFPGKIFPIFKKLQALEEKRLSSKDTAFTLDYKKVVSPLFEPDVAQKEWYSLKDNRPVDFLALLVHLSLRRPVAIDLLFINNLGIPQLINILREVTCRRMHASLISAIDALLTWETHDSRFQLLHNILRQLDYSLILNFAVDNEFRNIREPAQKIILHTLNCLDVAQKSDIRFSRPHKSDLINVNLYKLKDLISSGDVDDMIFGLMIVAEREETDHVRLVKENFPDLAVRIIDAPEEKYAKFTKDSRDQLIGRAMNLLVSIGPIDEKKFPYLMRHYTVKCLSRYYFSDDDDIKLLSRVCTVNICQMSFDRKLELFVTVPLEQLVDEIYGWYWKNQRNLMKATTYFHLMPVTIKLIHYYLCIIYHMRTSGVFDHGARLRTMKRFKQPDKFGNMVVYARGENWHKMMELVRGGVLHKSCLYIDPIVADRMAEVFSVTVFDSTMPERYNTIAVACFAHLMNDENLDVSKYINDRLIKEADGMYSDIVNRFYLSDGGDFREALVKSRIPKLSIKEKRKNQRKGCQMKTTDMPKSETDCTNIKTEDKNLPKAKNGKSKAKKKTEESKHLDLETLTVKDTANDVISVSEQDSQNAFTPEEPDKSPRKQPKICGLPICPRHEPSALTESDERVQKMKKCGKCRGVSYCSKECQVKHWVEHKKMCKAPL